MLSSLVIIALVAILAIFLRSDCDLPLMLLPYDAEADLDALNTSNDFDVSKIPLNGRFQDQVIWITGASSGIGAYLAEELTRSGAQLILSARRVDRLHEVADKCKLLGKTPLVLPLDVTDLAAHQSALDQIIEKFGHVDTVVLNAGKSQRNPAVTMTYESTKEIMDLNFFSVIHLTKIVLPHLISRNQGQLVVVTSLSGRIGTPVASSYSASKFALHGYFDALRGEISVPHNITISLVLPGPVESEISMHTIRDPSLPKQNEGKKMSTSRCVYLMAKGMHYKFSEMWISDQPFLFLTYFNVYMPAVSRFVVTHIVGPNRVKTLREGGNIYDTKSTFSLKSLSFECLVHKKNCAN